jgi:hypothetical protein
MLNSKTFDLANQTKDSLDLMATTIDKEGTFNSSNRVLPLSMIYNEDFSLHKTNASTNVSNSVAVHKRVESSKNYDNNKTNNS